MNRSEPLWKRTFRLLAEITRVGSPRQQDMAVDILRRLSDGRRVSRTTAYVVEALWQEAMNHAVTVRQIEEAPPRHAVRSIYWRHKMLFVDDWPIDELRAGHPVSRLLAADGWSA